MNDLDSAERNLLRDSRIYDPANAHLGLLRLGRVLTLLVGSLSVGRGILGLLGVGSGDYNDVIFGIFFTATFFCVFSSARQRTVALSLIKKLNEQVEHYEKPA